MKVLQLGKFYPVKGGVEKVMLDLTEGLSRRKIHCDMMCTSIDGNTDELQLNEYGRVIRCKSLFKFAATTISPAMIFKLAKECRKYDVIHIHHPDPMACMALFFSGYKGNVVLHWHSDIVKQKKLLKLFKPFQSWLIRRANRIVGTSPVYVKESPFLQDVQDKTTYLPIGTEKMNPDSAEVQKIHDLFPDKKIVFSMGRLVEYKGYKHLIDAAKHLGDEYVVLIGGEGPLKQELQNYIADNGLGNNVKLLGFIPDDMKASYYGACNIFCLSSVQKTEAFAIVQAEAMSCGKPVVATNIPGSGVPWVNQNNVSGLNVMPENGAELARAILEINEDKKHYEEYSMGAKMRYNALFSPSRMLDSCVVIYDNLTDETEIRSYDILRETLRQKAV